MEKFSCSGNYKSSSEKMRNIEEVPAKFRDVFSQYSQFNYIQSQVFEQTLYSDQSIVVAAPTASGKTAIFELAIIRFLLKTEDNPELLNMLKIIYVAPMKTLCQERLIDWNKKFANYGINCISVTGDSDNIDLQSLQHYNLIVTTPEKWDSLTRKWRDNRKFVQTIKLFLIDEVHLLNEETRGPTLEVIVCRMKTIENAINTTTNDNKIRYVAVSATVCNIEDVAEWLDKKNTICYKFSEDVRPVKIEKLVFGYPYNAKTCTPFKFDLSLNYKLPNLIINYSLGKPVLIFCSTRKSVEMTAKHLLQNLTINMSDRQKTIILEAIQQIIDVKLCETLKNGIGYHHAGLGVETRHLIEELFRNGHLFVLVTTSTLAMGVNLPAHLVIVKSTKCYANSGYQDYSETSLLQMIGRAGRPQYDTSAIALVLTTNEDKEKFAKICTSTQPLESNLHRHLVEHLNAEIALRTIDDLDVALQWLTSTFLYIRAIKNPKYYGFSTNLTIQQIDKKLLEMCQIEINKLVTAGMVTIDENINILPTETGIAMAKYCIAFKTMKLFTKITGHEVLQQILAIISKCHEFSELYLRVDDKKCLNMLNKTGNKSIRFQLKGRIKTLDMKINCIIQAVFGCMEIYDASILTDAVKIMRNGERITKCLIEYLQVRPNCYKALLSTILLAKCFQAQLWENSEFVSKQLTSIGNVMSKQLVNANKTTFEIIEKTNPREIEIICRKKPPFGDRIVEYVKHLPKYDLKMHLIQNSVIKLTVSLLNVEDLMEDCTCSRNSIMCLLVGDENSNKVLLHERYTHSYMISNKSVTKYLQKQADMNEVCAHFLSEDWIGFDCECFLSTNQSNNEKTDKKIEKKPPTYIQMFMDMYTKIKKNVPKPKNQQKRNKETKNKEKQEEFQEDFQIFQENLMEEESFELDTGNNKQIPMNESKENEEIIEISEDEFEFQNNDGVSESETALINEIRENEMIPEEIQDEFSESFFEEQIPENETVEEVQNFENDKKNDSENSIFNVSLANERVIEDISSTNNGKQSIFDESLTDEQLLLYESSQDENEENNLEKNSSILNDSVEKQVLYPKNSGNIIEIDETIANNTISCENLPENHSKCEKNEEKFWNLEKTYFSPKTPKTPVNMKQFRFQPRKKLSHMENLNQITKIDSTVHNSSESSISSYNPVPKCIKWRSPLIYSPQIKFSPKIPQDNNVLTIDEQDCSKNSESNLLDVTGSSKSSLQRWKLPKAQRTNPVLMKLRTSESVSRFPLSDTEYEVQENELLKNAMDEFCSTSFIEETTNLKKKTSFEKAVQYYSQLCENKENQPVKEKYKHKEAGNFIKERKYELEKRQLEDEMEKMYNMEKQRKNNKNHQFDGEIPCCSKSLRRESPKKEPKPMETPPKFPQPPYYPSNYYYRNFPQQEMPATPFPTPYNYYYPSPHNYIPFPPTPAPHPCMNRSYCEYNGFPKRFKRQLSGEEDQHNYKRRNLMPPNDFYGNPPPPQWNNNMYYEMPQQYQPNYYVMDKFFRSLSDSS